MSRNDLLNLNVLISSWLNTIDDNGVVLYPSYAQSGVSISEALEKLNINPRDILTWRQEHDNITIITN